MRIFYRKKMRRKQKIIMIPTSNILSNPNTIRKNYGYKKLLELAQSIDENGMINPVIITYQNKQPLLISGERRLQAAKILGMKAIPCIVIKSDNRQAAILSLIENLQRDDYNDFEITDRIVHLHKDYGMSEEDIANTIGLDQKKIARYFYLQRFTEDERKKIIKNNLIESHINAILELNNKASGIAILDRIVKEYHDSFQAESNIENLKSESKENQNIYPHILDIRLFINTMKHALDTMRRSGIDASIKNTENEEYFEYSIRIPKSKLNGSKDNQRRQDYTA